MTKINVSRLFLLPGIQLSNSLKKDFERFNFVNTYLKCDDLKYSFEVIFLLFKPDDFDISFYSFSRNMSKNPNYIETIDLNNHRVVMVFRIPKRFKEDYNHFLNGDYSKMSKEFQSCFALEQYKFDSNGNLIKENGKYVYEPTIFYHVFNKTQKLKDVWKLKLYGQDSKDGIIYEPDSNLIDEIELYEKQDPLLETLDVGFEIWR